MVVRYGMSEQLGLASYDIQRPRFLTPLSQLEGQVGASDYTARIIDSDVHRILSEGFELATKIIQKNLNFLNSGAETLLASET